MSRLLATRKIDEFDDVNPLYVTSISPISGKMRGALRLLPTAGAEHAGRHIPAIAGRRAGNPAVLRSGSPRFCIDPDLAQDRSSNQVTVAAAELMCGVGELGLASGIAHIVTVMDVFLERMFRRMGCPGERIGRPRRIGSVIAVAVGWEVTEHLLDHMKAVASITGPVLEAPMTMVDARQAA